MRQRQIYYDGLTDAYNRRYLYYWIDDEIKRANRFSTKFALIMLDLDNFREINNTYGHLEGDKVLVEFVKFLRTNIREVDSLVRYGGDEFIVLAPNTDTQGAIELAQRVISQLNSTEIANHKVLCSIGFAVYPDDGITAEALIEQSDNSMYQAKKEGKNRIGLKKEIIKKLKLPSPVVVGREDEILWCLEQMMTYNTIFIAGEAGIGKSRLVLEIKERSKDSILFRANSYAALSLVPYHPFRNMLSEIMNNDFTLLQYALKRISKSYLSEIMKLLPQEGFGPPDVLKMDKFRLFNSFTTFILKIGETVSPGTVFLFIDDLHWTDQPSIELLDFLIRSAKGRIKVLGTYRTEEIKKAPINELFGIWAREKLYNQIVLSPLNEFQTSRMLEAIMGSVSQDIVKFIYAQGGGNPFYTEEILRELEKNKNIYWNGKEWVLFKGPGLNIPSSIKETILRKIGLLDSHIKDFLEVAAVFGQDFNAEIIAHALKSNTGEALDAIDQLSKLGLIKERTPDVYFFSEDVVRQIVYKNISRAGLMKYHRLVGEAIEGYYQGDIQNYYEQLAHHFAIGNDPTKALIYSKKAALKCKNNYAHTMAIEFFTNVLKYEEDIDEIFKTKLSLAEVFYLAGDYPNAIKHLNDCIRTKPQEIKVYEKLGKVYENMGDYKNALKSYQKGIKIAKNTTARFAFQSSIALVYTCLGKYLKAKKECEKILKKKKGIPPEILGDTYVTLGVVFLKIGDYKNAEFFLKKALKIKESLGNKKGVAACYLDLAILYERKLDLKVCENLYKKAMDIYEEIGYQEGLVTVSLDLGVLYTYYDLQKEEEYYLRTLEIAKLIHSYQTLVYIHNNLGKLYYRRLIDESSLNNYRQALTYAQKTRCIEGKVFTNINLSEFYRENGQLKKGMRHLKKAEGFAHKVEMVKYYIYDCQMEEMEYLLIQNRLQEADVLTKRLFKDMKEEPYLW